MPAVQPTEFQQRVLLSFASKEVVLMAAIRQELPDLNRHSVAGALSMLTAERSVSRVRLGVYRLTDQGRARLATLQSG